MTALRDIAVPIPMLTDGAIAVMNLESARRRSWSRFSADPRRPGVAELIVEQEWHNVTFLGDCTALDRLDTLVLQLTQAGLEPARLTLIQAQIASLGHRFSEARAYLQTAQHAGAEPQSVRDLTLAIDQACGVDPQGLLEIRRSMAAQSESLETLLPLGTLLADLNAFPEADAVLQRALHAYADVSPFPIAQICFQLGMLWGELVPDPQIGRAMQWYRQAIDLVPPYARARVHLAELHLSCGHIEEAEILLAAAATCSDPEVEWRLADLQFAKGNTNAAEAHLQAAKARFDDLLDRHALAFADHAAAFFADAGNNPSRALDLARLNLANRPTLRAFTLAHTVAVSAGDTNAAADFLSDAKECWSATGAFAASPLAHKAAEQTAKCIAPC